MTDQSIKSRGILDIFPAFDAEERAKRFRSSAADDLFRGSLALDWKHIDFAKGVIRVEGAAVLDEHNNLVFKKTNKNKKSRRKVPIIQTALNKGRDLSEDEFQEILTDLGVVKK